MIALNKQDAIEKITDLFFGDQSPLKEAERWGGRPYEPREQQKKMANAIANALTQHQHLAIEAPTGVGKSFAYMIPGLYYALKTNLPTLISTETIALQEQLTQKDIPLLKNLLPDISFKSALAKGKNNYICRRRLMLATSTNYTLPSTVDATELEKIHAWASKMKEGSFSDLPFTPTSAVWHLVACESGNCSYPRCRFGNSCFYWNARKQWGNADLLVANHALLFTDLKMKIIDPESANNLIPPFGALIIDEAHTLEDSAAKHLGIHLSHIAIKNSLSRLFEPQSAKGLLLNIPGKNALELREKIAQIHLLNDSFFNNIQQLYKQFSSTTPGNYSQDPLLRLKEAHPEVDNLSHSLILTGKKLQQLAEELSEEEVEDFPIEVAAQSAKMDFLAETIHDFFNQTLEQHVYWMEASEFKSGNKNITLQSAPLNIPELLQETLFQKDSPPTILTSATLMVKNSFQYFQQRTGFTGSTLSIDSPFNYATQLSIHIPKSLPEPTHPDFEKKLPQAIAHYLQLTNGKAFVLFTAYSLMRHCFNSLTDFFQNHYLCAFIQGDTYQRSQMLSKFKKDINSVIFGTSSFWTGVDVPGEALSNVIITKLPFPVPSHPLIQARGEKIELMGGNSFRDYSLPEAILKLRQGTGRLIRSQTDKGILVILDKRIITKFYGKEFIKSLPEAPFIFDDSFPL